MSIETKVLQAYTLGGTSVMLQVRRLDPGIHLIALLGHSIKLGSSTTTMQHHPGYNFLANLPPSRNHFQRTRIVSRQAKALKKLLIAFFLFKAGNHARKYHYGPGFQNHPVAKMAFDHNGQI